MSNAREYFSSEGDVTIDGKKLQNLNSCLAPTICELIFKKPHFLWKGTRFLGSKPKVYPTNERPEPFQVS